MECGDGIFVSEISYRGPEQSAAGDVGLSKVWINFQRPPRCQSGLRFPSGILLRRVRIKLLDAGQGQKCVSYCELLVENGDVFQQFNGLQIVHAVEIVVIKSAKLEVLIRLRVDR